MSMEQTILTASIAAFPDKICELRIGRDVFSGWCSGLTEIKSGTDQGSVIGYSGEVRFFAADEPREIAKGEVFEIKRTVDTDFLKVRAAARRPGGGAVRLTIVSEFE
jgi:hypothetical protein